MAFAAAYRKYWQGTSPNDGSSCQGNCKLQTSKGSAIGYLISTDWLRIASGVLIDSAREPPPLLYSSRTARLATARDKTVLGPLGCEVATGDSDSAAAGGEDNKVKGNHIEDCVRILRES